MTYALLSPVLAHAGAAPFAAESEGGNEIAPWVVAVIAFVIFMALLGLLWSFRHTVAPKPVDRARRGTVGSTAAHGDAAGTASQRFGENARPEGEHH